MPETYGLIDLFSSPELIDLKTQRPIGVCSPFHLDDFAMLALYAAPTMCEEPNKIITLKAGLVYGTSGEGHRVPQTSEPLLDEFDELDDGGKQKQVFALAGLALFHADLFEVDLHNILALYATTQGTTATGEEIDALYTDLSGKTLGALLNKLRKVVEIDDGGIQLLEAAVQMRNQLCHGFFFRMADDFHTNAGKRRMCSELLRIRDVMSKAEMLSQVICKMLMKVRGITDEDLEAELEKSRTAARALDGE